MYYILYEALTKFLMKPFFIPDESMKLKYINMLENKKYLEIYFL